MWIDEIDTIETWVNGREVILKKMGRDYSYRPANEAGDWLKRFPDGMGWDGMG